MFWDRNPPEFWGWGPSRGEILWDNPLGWGLSTPIPDFPNSRESCPRVSEPWGLRGPRGVLGSSGGVTRSPVPCGRAAPSPARQHGGRSREFFGIRALSFGIRAVIYPVVTLQRSSCLPPSISLGGLCLSAGSSGGSGIVPGMSPPLSP